MTGSDLERRLTATLRKHAEDAMRLSRTEDRLQATLVVAERTTRRRRMGWAAGAAVAAAAAVVGFISLVPPLGGDQTETALPAQGEKPVEIATRFVEAYGSFDRDKAASYLADEPALIIDPSWRQYNSWWEAVGFELLPGSCEKRSSSPFGTRVDCPFDFHALGSDELGRGPFPDNVFSLTIQNGKIIGGYPQVPFETNGFSAQMWEPFAAWVSKAHPKDASVMYDSWPKLSQQALTPQSIRLWEKHTREYVGVARSGR